MSENPISADANICVRAGDLIQATSARADRRAWVGLGIMALPCLAYSMDVTVLYLALPALSESLKPTAAQLLWILDIYGFVVASMLIAMGVVGDRIGRRRLLLIGGGAFAALSVVAAFSSSAPMLIATRGLLGVAGAIIAPTTLALVRNMFKDPRERAVAISVWGMSYSAGVALGPLAGGFLLQYFWWGSVFLIAVPFMLVLLLFGSLIPEYRDPTARPIDGLSVALSLGCIIPIIFGLKRIAESGPQAFAIAAILCGLPVGWALVQRQSKLSRPMLDPKFFRLPSFAAPFAMYGATSFVIFGSLLYFGQYIQLVHDKSPLEAGMWTVPFACSLVVGAALAPALGRRLGRQRVLIAALSLAAIGFLVVSTVRATTSVPLIALAYALCGFAISPVMTLCIDSAVGSVPAENSGAASGMLETAAEFGGALGIALLGSLGTAVYRMTLDARLPPGTAAFDDVKTLGAAVEMGHHLGGKTGALLLRVTRDSFSQGMAAVALASACVLLAATALEARRRRRHRR